MRFVVIGAGSIGQRHLKNLVALGHEVAAVFDPSPVRLDEVRPLVGARCRLTADEGEAFDQGADATLICSPTHRHLDQARAALRRGWHVFVEKPLAHTLEGTDARSEEHTSELQSQSNLVCRLLLEKKNSVIVWQPV